MLGVLRGEGAYVCTIRPDSGGSIYHFISQFGTTALNCFVRRRKKTNSSTGVACVQVADPDVIPAILEECNGMLLGGRVVKAKKIWLKKPMPKKTTSLRRMHASVARVARGAPMRRHNVERALLAPPRKKARGEEPQGVDAKATDSEEKRPVANPRHVFCEALLRAVRKETQANKYFQSMGLKYEFHGFENQLKLVAPATLRAVKDDKVHRRAEKSRATAEAQGGVLEP